MAIEAVAAVSVAVVQARIPLFSLLTICFFTLEGQGQGKGC
jgi:hypothetical protein